MNIKKALGVVVGFLAVGSYYLIENPTGNKLLKDVVGVEISTSVIKDKILNQEASSPTTAFSDRLGLPDWGEESFYQSKKVLKEMTKRHPESFYCGCDIKFVDNTTLVPDLTSCGFEYRKNEERANRMEAEHIVPISWYGQNLQCWQNGGRSNCKKVSDIFNKAEGDLVNLQYAIGEVNGDRSNFRYGQWNGGGGQYGSCDAKVDFSNRRFQPREEIRGHIGRVHLYMKKKYGLMLSDSQDKLIEAWASKPPTAWECEYDKMLKDKYGSEAGNPYSEYACQLVEKMR